MRWIFDLYNQTKNRNLKHSLELIKCTREPVSHTLNDNSLNDPRYHIHVEQTMDMDVHNDLTVSNDHYNGRRQNTGEKIDLLSLPPNSLHCERVTDPTELPLQHEPVTGPDSWNLFHFPSSSMQLTSMNVFSIIFVAIFASVMLS